MQMIPELTITENKFIQPTNPRETYNKEILSKTSMNHTENHQ